MPSLMIRIEVSLAMQQAGFMVSPAVYQRYFNKYQKGNSLDFVQFMHMIADLSMIKSRFEVIDTDRDG